MPKRATPQARSPAATKSPSDKRRINVHITEQAYRKLIDMAGGEKRMAIWLEEVIERESRTNQEIANQEALEKLKVMRRSLDKFLKSLET